MAWLAVALVCGQGVVAYALLKAVKSLGSFTDLTVAAHKSNMLVHQKLEYQIDQVGEVKELLKLQREWTQERAVNRAATFVAYEPTSDRDKIA